jgi:hypothetical protein
LALRSALGGDFEMPMRSKNEESKLTIPLIGDSDWASEHDHSTFHIPRSWMARRRVKRNPKSNMNRSLIHQIVVIAVLSLSRRCMALILH